MASTALTAANLKQSDAAVILTNHSNVDYELLLRHAPVVVDTRNQYGSAGISSPKIVGL
jgi:UDP-N-acetyl-D-glucosamine dehydrogenase